MPGSKLPKTPEKIISPPARRTRSARKRRQSEVEKPAIQEKDVSTPRLTENDTVVATPGSTKERRAEKDSGVPLPPPPATPLPPLPPSARRGARSARKKNQSVLEKISQVELQPDSIATPGPTQSAETPKQSTRSTRGRLGSESSQRDDSSAIERLTNSSPTKTPATPEITKRTRKRKGSESSQKDESDAEDQAQQRIDSPAKKSKEADVLESPRKKNGQAKKQIASVKNQIEVKVHRMRNINYIPKGILRLCATPYSPDSNYCPQLAVSREGGSVELVSVNEKWKCVGIVEGMKNRSVDAMAWVSIVAKYDGQSQPMFIDEDGPASSTEAYFSKEHQLATEAQKKRRLYGASRDGTIFEIDFKTKKLSGIIGSGGGAVFCLTSLCSNDTNRKYGNLIAAGCEDGSVRIYRAAETVQNRDNGPCLELVSTLPSVGGAVISLAWLPGSGVSGMAGSVIYAGASDGTIRRFDCTSSLQIARMTGNAPHAISTGAVLNNDNLMMEAEEQMSSLRWKAGSRMTVENLGRRSSTKIWALKALKDGTVISGDSLGNVQFWDGNAGTLLQSFEHNQNNGDVFDIAVSYNQNKVMASGVDSKVVCIERVPSSSSLESNWVLTNQQRSHTHDVNSLAMVYLSDPSGNLDSAGKLRELLCSGGVDTKVCSYFVADMKKYRAKTAYKYPTRAPISLSKGPRILSIMRSDKIDFYQLASIPKSQDLKTGTLPQDEHRAYIGSVSITSSCNLVSMDVSDDGKLLAVSHAAGLMLFSLHIVETTDEKSSEVSKVIVPKQISVPRDADVPCSALKFGSDCLICSAINGPINIIRFQVEMESTVASLDYTISNKSSSNTYACEDFPIVQIAISADFRWFAVTRNVVGKGSLQVFSLSKKKFWWTLPCTEAPHSCINFLGGDDETNPALAVACNNGVVYLFDVEHRCLSNWSQDMGFPVGPHLPRELMTRPDCPESLSYNKATPNKFVMGGHSWFSSIDLSSPVPLRSKPFPTDHFMARNWSKSYLLDRKRSISFDVNDMKKIEEDMKRDEANKNFTICLRYSGIVFQDFLDTNEMVIVEQPWLSIVNTLPDALERQRYGS